MKVFHCSHCEHVVFFENTACVHCRHKLAYLPDLQVVASIDPAGDDLWRTPRHDGIYRLCGNYVRENICNWTVPNDEAFDLCYSCRLTQVVPNLDEPGNRQAWYKLEVAKRRVLYSLVVLGCPVESKSENPDGGLAFQFLAETDDPNASPVLTGHANGIITINVAEADDVERERRKLHLHEPYRTLLGHFRHEVGHYYWDRLIKPSASIDAFRQYFGDERKDYGQALLDHYQKRPPDDWTEQFVTAYAAAHPLEDWAETWAHYLHMADTLETAAACGVSLRPKRSDEPKLTAHARRAGAGREPFDQLIERWFSITYILNNLNRGLGLPDAYPFVLAPAAISKLQFVHNAIAAGP